LEKLLIIGAGGFIGAVARFLVAGWVQIASGSIDFPYGTVAVNLIGCFVIGLLAYLADMRGLFDPEVRLFLFIGVLGSFTTFSTFENETYSLFRNGVTGLALIDIGVHVLFGLVAVWAGHAVAGLIWR
jgi:CrcB protein